MSALAHRLDGGELTRAQEYYDEIISDRMEDGMSEEEAVAALGDIDSIAAEIGMKKPSGRRFLIPMIVGSPLWVPLFAAFLILLWSLIFALAVVFASLALVGIIGILYIPFAAMTSVTYCLMVAGSGLVCGGLALMLFPAVLPAIRGSARLTARCFSMIFGK